MGRENTSKVRLDVMRFPNVKVIHMLGDEEFYLADEFWDGQEISCSEYEDLKRSWRMEKVLFRFGIVKRIQQAGISVSEIIEALKKFSETGSISVDTFKEYSKAIELLDENI